MAKLIDKYYYHLTTESILPFIRKGGFTTQYHRTKKFAANPAGAFLKNKNEQMESKIKEFKKILIQKICAMYNLQYYVTQEPNVNNLAQSIVNKLNEGFRRFQRLETYPSWEGILTEGALVHGNSNEARVHVENYITDNLKEILNQNPFKAVNNKNILAFKKLLIEILEKCECETLDFIAKNWCELWYKAEEYVCVTHSYFFNLNGLLDNLNTYLGHLGRNERFVLLRINADTSIANFKQDWSQSEAFITSDIIHPRYISRSRITDSTTINQLILKIKQNKNNEVFGIGETIDIEDYAYSKKTLDSNIKNDFLSFVKSFELFPEHSQGYFDPVNLEWV